MTYEQERRRWEAIQIDRAAIGQAALFLRHHAIQSQYVDRRRAIVDVLMTVRLHAVGRGTRTFRPETVEIRWQGR